MPRGKTPDDATSGAPEELSFEEALARLEEIVAALESGQMSLDESLRQFEEGTQLQRVCLEKLKQAEARIEQVLAENAVADEDDLEVAPEGEAD